MKAPRRPTTLSILARDNDVSWFIADFLSFSSVSLSCDMVLDTFFFPFHIIISRRKDVGEPQTLICMAGKVHGVWVRLLLPTQPCSCHAPSVWEPPATRSRPLGSPTISPQEPSER